MTTKDDKPEHGDWAQGAYPSYTRGERIADGVIHIAAILASLIAFSIVLAFAVTRLSVPLNAALIVYGLSVFALFCCSAAYHMTPWPRCRPLLRRFDQAAIFMKIGGSYTPLVVLIDTFFGYIVLIVVWGKAIFGAGGKIIFGRLFEGYSTVLYLALGWANRLIGLQDGRVVLDSPVDDDLDEARVMEVYRRLDPDGTKADEYERLGSSRSAAVVQLP